MYITRRQLLKSSLLLIPALGSFPAVLRRVVDEALLKNHSATVMGGHVLILVQMAGGNDGLNTIIPFDDGRYYDSRPNLAIPQKQVIPLNTEVGFHPSLTEFKSMWDEGVLAIIEGVGYPKQDLSHFKSMDIWRTADPEIKRKDGWLGRYLETLDRTQHDVFQGLAVGKILPRELSSPDVAIPVVESVAVYQFQGDTAHPESTKGRIENLLELYTALPSETPYSGILTDTIDVAYKSAHVLQEADLSYTEAVEYPDTPFASGLRLLAKVITGNLGLKVGHVTLGGFDTHADQKDAHSQLLQILASGIHAFYQDLKAHGKDRDVVVMTWSEFGRRVKSNASDGTDHGSAGPQFIIGTPVSGGFYGKRPNLADIDNGNLRFTTDFRRVYETVLEKWLGVSSEVILGQKQFEELSLFS